MCKIFTPTMYGGHFHWKPLLVPQQKLQSKKFVFKEHEMSSYSINLEKCWQGFAQWTQDGSRNTKQQ